MKRVCFLLLSIFFLVACGGNTEEPTPAPASGSDAETSEVSEETTAPADDADEAGSGEPEAGDSAALVSEADKVVIQHAVYDFDQGRYEDLIEAFEEQNPNITIQLVSLNEVLGIGSFGGEWPEDAELRLASAADVLGTGFSAQAVDQGLLLDLTPLLSGEAGVSQDDFYPQLLSQSSYKGGIYALPLDASYNLIYFDKDAFDEAGLDYPEPGWTWDDFLTAAEALTVREGNEVTQWGFVEPFPSGNFLQAFAGPIFDLETEPPQIDFEGTAVQEALQWYTDLFLVHEVAPLVETELEGNTIPEGYQMIEEGLAAMWPEFSSSWGFRSEQRNVGIVPFPVSSANQNTTPLISTNMLSISSGSQHPNEAWAWINFLAQQPEIIGFNFNFGGPTTLPARRSVAEVSGFWDEVDEELGEALAFAVDHAYDTPRVSWGYGELTDAIQAVLAEEKTVTEALAEAQVEAENARDEQLAGGEEEEAVEVVVAAPDVEEVDPDAVTIEYMVGGVPDLQLIRDLAAEFEEANPGIHVEIKQPNFGSGSITIEDIAEDADCFQWFPSFDDPDNLAAVISLDPFFDSDPTISKDDFYPAAMAPFTHQGQVWGLPGELSMSVIEYNKDLFDAANIPYPTPDWTTEEFLAAAVALTSGEGDSKQYGYVPSIFESQDLLIFMERLGAQLIDDSLEPSSITFTDPTVIEAMRWFVDLTTEFEVKPVFMTDVTTGFFSFDERMTLIDNGLAGMWLQDSSDNFVVVFGDQEEEESEEQRTGIVPLPAGPTGEQVGGYNLSGGYFISAETDARQACWDWLVYLTGQPGPLGGLPARTAVAQSEAYKDSVGEETAAVYLQTIEGNTRPSLTQRLSQSDSWLGISFIWLSNAYDQVLHDDVSIEEALAQAQEKVDIYRDCIISNEAFSDNDAQADCLREADPSLPEFFFSGSDDD